MTQILQITSISSPFFVIFTALIVIIVLLFVCFWTIDKHKKQLDVFNERLCNIDEIGSFLIQDSNEKVAKLRELQDSADRTHQILISYLEQRIKLVKQQNQKTYGESASSSEQPTNDSGTETSQNAYSPY